MHKLKTIGNVCLVLLSVIAVCISIAYIYIHFFIDNVTTGINYIDNQIGVDILDSDNLSETEKNVLEERYFLEANFYSNSKCNGIALQELKLNYFMDYNLTSDSYRSTGAQYLGDLKPEDLVLRKNTEEQSNNWQETKFSYYDTSNGISWSGNKLNTQLTRNTSFIIKIDNRAFSIQLTGTEKFTTYYKFLFWDIPQENTLYYNYTNVFVDCMEAIRSNSYGYGDYYIIVDLSKYFTIKEYDLETGKFKADDVTDIIKNYSVLKFHYDENGALNSNQSIFKTIDCNPSFDLKNDNILTDYWQATMFYEIKEDDLNYVYNKTYGGYLITSSNKINNIIKFSQESEFSILIDLQSDYFIKNKINVVGFATSSFNNIQISTLKISGSSQNFYFLDKSFNNSFIELFTYSDSLNIFKADTSLTNVKAEVKFL